MPKKVSNALRLSQPTTTVPAHMRSHLTRTSSVTRKPTSAVQKQVEKDVDDMEIDEDDRVGEEEYDDDNMVEMLTMLQQEIQKRKVTKSSARSAVFQREKTTLFTESRKRAESAMRKGNASIDRARTLIAELKANEVRQESGTLTNLLESQAECLQGALGHLSGIVEDLSHRRAAQINESSAMLGEQASAREKSRKRLWALASTRISENMEKQKISSDASALIKHYQALLLS